MLHSILDADNYFNGTIDVPPDELMEYNAKYTLVSTVPDSNIKWYKPFWNGVVFVESKPYSEINQLNRYEKLFKIDRTFVNLIKQGLLIEQGWYYREDIKLKKDAFDSITYPLTTEYIQHLAILADNIAYKSVPLYMAYRENQRYTIISDINKEPIVIKATNLNALQQDLKSYYAKLHSVANILRGRVSVSPDAENVHIDCWHSFIIGDDFITEDTLSVGGEISL